MDGYEAADKEDEEDEEDKDEDEEDEQSTSKTKMTTINLDKGINAENKTLFSERQRL